MAVVSTKTGLALQIYAKTIAAFQARNVFKEICTVQTITAGFSHRFNVMGTGIDTDVSSFDLGDTPSESQLSVNKRDITVDRTLVSRKNVGSLKHKALNFKSSSKNLISLWYWYSFLSEVSNFPVAQKVHLYGHPLENSIGTILHNFPDIGR